MDIAIPRSLALAAMLAALAGCSDRPEPPQAASDDATAAAEAPADEAPEAGPGELAAPLPQDVVLPFPYYVRSDELATSEQGVPRRRIRIEFLEGDVATVAAQVAEVLGEAGFTAGATDTTGAGATRTNFRKDGYGRVTAVVGPTEEPVDPDAKGLLVLDWPDRP